MTVLDRVVTNAFRSFRPPPKLTLSEWADEHAYLSAESSAQAGKWKTLHYQRGMMDAITDPTVTRVTVMKSARIGYTKILNNIIGYHIHQDPCPIMVVQPAVEDAEGYSKDEIAPMLRDTPVLRNLVAESKAKVSTNTILKKTFPGGQLLMIGANSPRGFRRVSMRIVLFDEVDGYPLSAGAEGDQIKLGERRTEYYWNRKIIMGSTPTTYDTSRIRKSFELSDMRRYYVPCPHCGHYQILRWSGFTWTKGSPETVMYECESCSALIDHSEKHGMLEKGEWRAERPFTGYAGFHIWAGYSESPNATWQQLVTEYELLQDDVQRKTFVNTVLGEAWSEETIELTEDALRDKREDYGAELPDGVLLVTAAVDTQDDRLEYEIVGWGMGKRSWGIEYGVLPGCPGESRVWDDLDRILLREFSFADGKVLSIKRTCIDSGGHYTTAVYEFCAPREERGVFAIKGVGGSGIPIVGKPSLVKKYNAHLFRLGVNELKTILYSRLSKDEEEGNTEGLCRFPLDIRGYDDAYFRGLISEHRVLKFRNGQPVYVWEKKHKGIRNEPLDLRDYATAAMEIYKPDFKRLAYELSQQQVIPKQEQKRPLATQRRVISRGVDF